MKNRAYYHVFMTDDLSWSYIFIHQMDSLINSGLISKLDLLVVVCVGGEESKKHMIGLLGYYNHLFKTPISLYYFDKTYNDEALKQLDQASGFITETKTLEIIWNDSKATTEPFNIVYFHSKGVTAIERVLKTGDYARFVNYLSWRKFNEWSIFDKHEDAINLLNDYDAIGSNYSAWPTPHFSGNMWWTRSDYIKTLENPEDQEWWTKYKKNNEEAFSWLPDRLNGEMWIGSGDNVKLYSFHDHPRPPPISNLGNEFILKQDYYK